MDSPATTTATTYTIRVGTQPSSNLRFNGTYAGRYLGGASRTILVVQEIKV